MSSSATTESNDSKSWFFLDDEGRVKFTVSVEYAEAEGPPEDLLFMIELYSIGYRERKEK